jgi:hypothetical protein
MNKAKAKALELAIQYVDAMPEKMLNRVFMKIYDIEPQKTFTFRRWKSLVQTQYRP